MRVLLSGGGTGGHIYPALAIGNKILSEDKNAVIEYVGTERGLETRLVTREGYKIHYVKVQGIRRSISAENIKALLYAVTSVLEAKKIIKEFRPDIVIGTGGYVCWPVLKAASQMKIPTLVHESNAIAGVATKMLAPHVSKVLFNFSETAKSLNLPREKYERVGNPIKQEMFTLKKSEMRAKHAIPDDARVVLSFGGSLGAKSINDVILEILRDENSDKEIYHFHATGAKYWEASRELLLSRGFIDSGEDEIRKGNYFVRKYFYDMPEMLALSDVVICRAGAMTVSEVSAMGKAAIFIPSPNVTDNHQYKNAHVLEAAGAARLIEEKNLNYKSLCDAISDYFENTDRTKKMCNKLTTFAVPDCLDRIYRIILDITR